MRPYKRSLRLINKPFQLRLALYVCSWLIALGVAFPLATDNLFDVFINYAARDPMGPELEGLYAARRDLTWLLLIWSAVMVSLTFVASLMLGHRIAGPLYKLGLFFRKVKDGDLSENIGFRKYDHFKELATGYNEMVGALRERTRDAASHIQAAMAKADPESKAHLEAALKALPVIERASGQETR